MENKYGIISCNSNIGVHLPSAPLYSDFVSSAYHLANPIVDLDLPVFNKGVMLNAV